MEDDNVTVLKVSGSSAPKPVASVLSRAVEAGEANRVKLRAIGAGAVNQASKACAIARGYAAVKGIDLVFILGFEDVSGEEGKTVSALVWHPVVRK